MDKLQILKLKKTLTVYDAARLIAQNGNHRDAIELIREAIVSRELVTNGLHPERHSEEFSNYDRNGISTQETTIKRIYLDAWLSSNGLSITIPSSSSVEQSTASAEHTELGAMGEGVLITSQSGNDLLSKVLMRPDWSKYQNITKMDVKTAKALAFNIDPDKFGQFLRFSSGNHEIALKLNAITAYFGKRASFPIAQVVTWMLSEKRWDLPDELVKLAFPVIIHDQFAQSQIIPTENDPVNITNGGDVNATTAKHSEPPSDEKLDGVEKRECQIRVIEYVATQFGYQHLSIPNGGKKALLDSIIKSYPNLFGAGKDPFKDAWTEAIKQNRIRMKNHTQYAKK